MSTSLPLRLSGEGEGEGEGEGKGDAPEARGARRKGEGEGEGEGEGKGDAPEALARVGEHSNDAAIFLHNGGMLVFDVQLERPLPRSHEGAVWALVHAGHREPQLLPPHARDALDAEVEQ